MIVYGSEDLHLGLVPDTPSWFVLLAVYWQCYGICLLKPIMCLVPIKMDLLSSARFVHNYIYSMLVIYLVLDVFA